MSKSKKINETCQCGKCKNQYTEGIEISEEVFQKIEELRGDRCREVFMDELIQLYLKNKN